LKIALKAIELGADIERVCKSLTWQEFEDISVLAFEANDFRTTKHLRFTWADRRWEIDILALKEPLVLCADCKHWRHGWSGSGSRKAVEMQVERTKFLAEASKTIEDKIGIGKWKRTYFVPMILSLVPASEKFYKNVPIVSVLQLGDFLPQMPAFFDKIAHFHQSVRSTCVPSE
jgi:Holliday junction resolvase-like predicted endonuclease